jgi:hypothetical protein
MIVLSIFSLGMDIVMRNEPPGWLRIIRFMGMVWLMVFLLILKSVTGLVITIVLGLGLGVMVFVKTRHVALKYFVAALWLTATFLMVWTGLRFHVRYSYRVPIDFSTLETHTVNGRPYLHDTLNQQTENGYRTWLYMCEEELEASWTRRSTAEYSGRDANGNELRHTLIRYLTSRGLPKDSLGISRLSHEEIQWIEQGVANVIFTDGYSLYRLFYELAWQVDAYRQGGNPSGHSVTQRIEYMKAGWGIFLKNPIFGVGTGDVPDAFDRQYKAMHSMLSDEWRLRAHNQYLTFLISFGLVGFIVAIWAMFHPVFLQKGCTQFRFAVFLTIALLSMIPEDTLETSAGAMFISFFYAVLLFGTKSKIS